MKIARSYAELKDLRGRLDGRRVAFVPTMGALHEGHLSLIRLARQKADAVVVSVFVNPTQFAPHEDFDAYPRDLDSDAKMLEAEGVGLVYAPSEADMYPDGAAVGVQAGAAAKGLETDFRPHFFDGVTTVVHRLFERVQPTIAVFGEKDFQQLQVICEMVTAQDMSIEIVGAPIVRDEHGLALSSRNAYLSEEELDIARMLNQAMYKVAADLASLMSFRPERSEVGESDRLKNEEDPSTTLGMTQEDMLKQAKEMLLEAGFDKIDYVAYRPEWRRVLVAAWLGTTRLIDNCAVSA